MKSPCGILWKGVLTVSWNLLRMCVPTLKSQCDNYGSSFFSESFSARRLTKQLQSAPIPPLVPKLGEIPFQRPAASVGTSAFSPPPAP